MIRSLRFRLTALYLAFFSLLFILFSAFLYNVLSNALQARLDETLSAEDNTLASLLQDELLEMKGELGVIAPGAYADIIAVPGDPLANVDTLKNPSFVMKDGNVFKQP